MCGNAVIQVRFSSYSSHVSAMAILFAYNALSYDRPTRSKDERRKIDGRGRMERDAHYANEQTIWKMMTMKSADGGDDLCFALIRDNCVK